jgi:hypothetical protein
VKLWVPVIKVSLRPVIIGGSGAKPATTAKKQVKLRSKRWILPAAGVIILLLAGYFIWHSLGTPSHGTVAVIAPDTNSQTKLPEYTTLTTNYYSLNYSLRYSQVPADIPAAGLLDQKILAYKLGGQPGQSKIEIDIKAAPDGGITLDSNYDYYMKHPAQYKLSAKYYHGEAIDIARSTKGAPETAGLWLHGSWLMIVRVTTADPHQNIDGELKDLLSSVQWRE